MTAPLTVYDRFARQIALPEVGLAGQLHLAEAPVDLSHWPPEAASLHLRAGGSLDVPGLAIEAPPRAVFETPAAVLGAGAWAAVEAARRVLGEAPAVIPAALVARLGGAP